MARVFVSYAKSERDLTHAVVALLEAAGHTVRWDTELVSGETYRDALDRELDAADAVVVIWTPSPVRSSWVIAEADHGLRLGKLVPLRTDGLETWQIPKPFGTFHTELASVGCIDRSCEPVSQKPARTFLEQTVPRTPRRDSRWR